MSGARILLVEDDESLCDLIERNLEMRHHEVSIAVDAQSALAYLRRADFDLIILDINLPDQTGWEVLRIALQEGRLPLVKTEDDIAVIPVVVLSAVRVSQRRVAEFRPLAYLPKPFPMESLLRFATQATERRNLHSVQKLNTPSIALSSHEEELHA